MDDPRAAATTKFLATGPVGVLTISMDAVVVFANEAACEYLERDPAGLAYAELIYPDDRARMAAGDKAMASRTVKRRGRGAIWRMVLPDGRALEILGNSAFVEIEGQYYGQLGFLPAPPRLAVLKTLETVAAARPLDETFVTLVDGIATDESGIAINWVDTDGSVRTFGNVDGVLAGLDALGGRDDDGASPWSEAARQGTVARRDQLDALLPDVAAAARAGGYEAVCVSPIPDPATGLELLYINWVRHPSHLDYVEQTFADVLADVLRIALERADHSRQLEHAANHDQLTGLVNRRAFFPALAEALGQGTASVLYLDLDHFKPVNDRLGHDAGDLVLVAVAERLSACAPGNATVARLGGDEFAIAIPGDDGRGAQELSERLVAELPQPFDLEDYGKVSVGVSIGYAVTDGSSGDDPHVLMLAADEALRAAKGEGKGTWVRARRQH